MDRKVQWILVALLAVALAYAAFVTRYHFPDPGARVRVDRWTGARHVWGECVEYLLPSGERVTLGVRRGGRLAEALHLDALREAECVRYVWREE